MKEASEAMPTPKVPMSKIRRVLQQLHEARLSQRETARATGVSKTSVSEIASCARAVGLTWAQAQELDDEALQARLYPPPVACSSRHLEPDWAQLHQQLKRPGVTLQLLWEKYQSPMTAARTSTALSARSTRALRGC